MVLYVERALSIQMMTSVTPVQNVKPYYRFYGQLHGCLIPARVTRF